VCAGQTGDLAQFHSAKTAAARQAHRIQPVFRNLVVALDVNVRGLAPVGGIEEKR
jgi:hypothetical protein